MPWFRVDDNLGFHHKVLAAGNGAMGLWVRAGSIAASQLTDGFISTRMAATLGTSAQARKLVDVGLWDEVEGGFAFHEWAERQPTRAEVEAERVAARDRMKAVRARKTGAKVNTSAQVTAIRSPEPTAKFEPGSEEVRDVFGNPYPALPNPTQEEPSSEVADATTDRGPSRPDVDKILDHLDDRCRANGFKIATRTKKNTDAARLLLDRDGYTLDQVLWLITWATNDEFWRSNIRSASKLREKFDVLKDRAMASKAKAAGRDDTSVQTAPGFEWASR